MPVAEGDMNKSSKRVFLKELLGLDCQVKFGSFDLGRKSVMLLTAIASVHPVHYPSTEIGCESEGQNFVLLSDWILTIREDDNDLVIGPERNLAS